jgi:transposase
MWDGYLGAIYEFMAEYPDVKAQVVIDRFHVAKNYREDFDNLRKKEMSRLKKELPEQEYNEVGKGMHWLLRHNHDNLSQEEQERLNTLWGYSPRLHKAYTLREELTAILNTNFDVAEGRQQLENWVKQVKESGLTCFDTFLKTLTNRLTEIANYFARRVNSGFVEGLNNKLKIITRRCYGLKRVDSLFRRLWLDMNGYQYFMS